MVSETYEFERDFYHGNRADASSQAAAAKAEGKAEDVLTVLEERGLPVSDEDRERITSSADSSQLDQWLRRAVTAAKASDLFAD